MLASYDRKPRDDVQPIHIDDNDEYFSQAVRVHQEGSTETLIDEEGPSAIQAAGLTKLGPHATAALA